MELIEVLEELDSSNPISEEARDKSSDCVGFVIGLHNLLVDLGVINGDAEVDVSLLEDYYTSLVGEVAAAALVLTSFEGIEEEMLQVHENLKDREKVPEVLVQGYKKMAQRVIQTRKSLDNV